MPRWPVPSVFPSRALAQQLGNARINGVLVGSQTYSFRALQADPKSIIEGFKTVGLFSAELMSNHAEGLAGSRRCRTSVPASAAAAGLR